MVDSAASGHQSCGSGLAGGTIVSQPAGNSGGDVPGYSPQYMGGGWGVFGVGFGLGGGRWFWRSPGGLVSGQASDHVLSLDHLVYGWFSGWGGGGISLCMCPLGNGGDGGGGHEPLPKDK